MSFDQSLQRVLRRLSVHRQSNQPDIVLDDSALVEADQLSRDAQPADPAHPTPDESQRLVQAYLYLGLLFYQRYSTGPSYMVHVVRPEGPHLVDLARAIGFLAPLADSPAAVPVDLHTLLGPSAMPAMQADLGLTLLEASKTVEDPQVVEAAVSLLAAAMAAAPAERPIVGEMATTVAADHPRRAQVLSALVHAYRRQCRETATTVDLSWTAAQEDPAAATGSQMGEPSPRGGDVRMSPDLTEALADLDRVLVSTMRREAVANAGDPNHVATLDHFSSLYFQRFQRTGVLADLDHTIELLEQAVDTAADEYPGRGELLSNLCSCYSLRFNQTGESSDLDRLIEVGERAMTATPADHPHRAAVLSNLGSAHLSRHERTGAAADSALGIEFTRQAVAATPPHHPMLAGRLSNLAAGYLRRHDLTGAMSDLAQSIEVGCQAVEAAGSDDPGRESWLYNLTQACGRLEAFLTERGDRDFLDQAIELFERVMSVLATNDVDRAGTLYSECVALLAGLKGLRELLNSGQAIDLIDVTKKLHGYWVHRAFANFLSCLAKDAQRLRAPDAGLDAPPAEEVDYTTVFDAQALHLEQLVDAIGLYHHIYSGHAKANYFLGNGDRKQVLYLRGFDYESAFHSGPAAADMSSADTLTFTWTLWEHLVTDFAVFQALSPEDLHMETRGMRSYIYDGDFKRLRDATQLSFYLNANHWRDDIARIAQQMDYFVVYVSSLTESVLWELGLLERLGRADHTTVVFDEKAVDNKKGHIAAQTLLGVSYPDSVLWPGNTDKADTVDARQLRDQLARRFWVVSRDEFFATIDAQKARIEEAAAPADPGFREAPVDFRFYPALAPDALTKLRDVDHALDTVIRRSVTSQPITNLPWFFNQVQQKIILALMLGDNENTAWALSVCGGLLAAVAEQIEDEEPYLDLADDQRARLLGRLGQYLKLAGDSGWALRTIGGFDPEAQISAEAFETARDAVKGFFMAARRAGGTTHVLPKRPPASWTEQNRHAARLASLIHGLVDNLSGSDHDRNRDGNDEAASKDSR